MKHLINYSLFGQSTIRLERYELPDVQGSFEVNLPIGTIIQSIGIYNDRISLFVLANSQEDETETRTIHRYSPGTGGEIKIPNYHNLEYIGHIEIQGFSNSVGTFSFHYFEQVLTKMP